MTIFGGIKVLTRQVLFELIYKELGITLTPTLGLIRIETDTETEDLSLVRYS